MGGEEAHELNVPYLFAFISYDSLSFMPGSSP
jgi:hypothetical protein